MKNYDNNSSIHAGILKYILTLHRTGNTGNLAASVYE